MAIQQPQAPRLQIIGRICCLALAVLLTTACSKESDEPRERLNISQQVALLQNTAGATATVDVSAEAAWTLRAAGEGYEITPSQGVSGLTSVTITATDENPQKARRRLGSVRFMLADDAAEARVLEVIQRPAVASQTMLLYMPGWSLLSFYRSNIAGIKAAINAHVPGDGRILVCYQSASNADRATLSEIYYDADTQQSAERLLKTYDGSAPDAPAFNAGDPTVVRQLFADAANFAPAQSYGLMIGCHGKAWVPTGRKLSGSSLNRRPAEQELWTPRPGALVTRSSEEPAPVPSDTRGFGDPGRELEIAQLAAAMQAQDYRFSYLIFDACFMANIETLYDLRGAVDRVIAAPCEIMGAGFPYDRAIPRLFADEGASCDLEKTCWEFWNFYQNDWESVRGNAQSGCISLAVTDELESLAGIIQRINDKQLNPYERNDLQIYEGLSTHIFYDLGHYVETVCPDAGLLAEFSEQLDKAFPAACRLHTDAFYSAYNHQMNPVTHYSGVSVSEPSLRYTQENQQTEWYKDTHK